VEDHGDIDQGLDLEQGEGVEQPPNADHDQEFCVELEAVDVLQKESDTALRRVF
jgi:hypothetical protein